MICINCQHPRTNVTNSRPHKTQPRVWRRRQCPKCHTLVSTYEQIDTADHQLIDRTAYSAARMAISIYSFLPSSSHAADDAFALAQTIGESLAPLTQASISKSELASMAWHILSRFNKKAGLKYGIEHDCVGTGSIR